MHPVQGFPTYTSQDRQFIEEYCNQVEKSLPAQSNQPASSSGFSVPSMPSYSPTFVDNSIRIASDNTFGNTVTVHVNPSRPLTQEEEEEKRKKEEARRAAQAGGIFTLAGALLLGIIGRRFQTALNNLEATNKMLTLKDNHPIRENYFLHQHPIYANLEMMVEIQQKYDHEQWEKIKKEFTATVLFLGSSVALGLGGLYRKQEMIRLGIIGVVAALALGLFSVAWHWNTDSRVDYQRFQLNRSIGDIRNYIYQNPHWNALVQPTPPFGTPPAYPQMYPPTGGSYPY